MSLVGILDSDELITEQRGWVEDALSVGEFFQESMWTETITVAIVFKIKFLEINLVGCCFSADFQSTIVNQQSSIL